MDTSTFLKRALLFQNELQRQAYPNASTFAQLCKCSRSTAMRTIDRLRHEFGVPMEYDESHRGYYLTDPDFSFASLPPGRDELVVLILLSELSSLIDDASLGSAVSGLWARITNGRSDVRYDLEQVRTRFSSETTSIAKLADVDLLKLLNCSHTGQCVKVRYRSPWRHDEDKEYVGRFDRFHFSDGILYALFEDYKQGAGNPEKLVEAFTRSIPLGRIGQPQDLPGAIAFFASEGANYITGQVLSVSGGLTMAG
jgi:hypothetical protein